MSNTLGMDWPDRPTGTAYERPGAQAFCDALLEQWSEVDSIAAALCHSPWRAPAAPLYAFARTANMFCDDPAYAGRRADTLRAWEHHLERAFHGDARHPVLVALAHVAREFDIPITPLRDILASYWLDLAGQPPSTFAVLLQHCRLAAGSVGQLILHLCGDARPYSLDRMADLAVGVRLADIVADLDRDLRRGRIYVPEEDLAAFGVNTDELLAGGEAANELVQFQAARARSWLARGRPVLRTVGPEARALSSMLVGHAHSQLREVEVLGSCSFPS